MHLCCTHAGYVSLQPQWRPARHPVARSCPGGPQPAQQRDCCGCGCASCWIATGMEMPLGMAGSSSSCWCDSRRRLRTMPWIWRGSRRVGWGAWGFTVARRARCQHRGSMGGKDTFQCSAARREARRQRGSPPACSSPSCSALEGVYSSHGSPPTGCAASEKPTMPESSTGTLRPLSQHAQMPPPRCCPPAPTSR